MNDLKWLLCKLFGHIPVMQEVPTYPFAAPGYTLEWIPMGNTVCSRCGTRVFVSGRYVIAEKWNIGYPYPTKWKNM